MSKSDELHRYGRHYTPLEVASLLAAFAVRDRRDLILDPSCGDGRLLREALKLKSSSKRPRSRLEVFGIDRSTAGVDISETEPFRFGCANFFDIEPGAKLKPALTLPPAFDAIVGNPPYIRQEVMGSVDKRRIESRLIRDRAGSPELLYPNWSRRSDIYVYFFAHSAAFLRVGGRLVFLTAASWLNVGYGIALRRFLLANFRIIAIIESGCESFFTDASINTVITVAEREPDPESRSVNPVRFVRLSAPLGKVYELAGGARPAAAFASSIEGALSPVETATHRIRVVSQAELMRQADAAESKDVNGVTSQTQGWGRYLRADDIFFRVLERGGGTLKQLSDLARVRFGVKTGANEFFYVAGDKSTGRSGIGSGSDFGEGKKRGGMRRLDEVASVRRGLTTGANAFFYLRTGKLPTSTRSKSASRSAAAHSAVEDGAGDVHSIEARYLSPVVFSLKELPGILLEQKQTRRLLFNCAATKGELRGTRALEYIRSGEQKAHHLRPTCAARNPWYSVARGMEPAPLILPSKVGERWVVAINQAGVFEDKKLYGVFPQSQVPAFVLAALLNSTWVRYYAEITCRQMTGAQAIADIDVAVAEGIVLPDPRKLPARLRRRLEDALGALAGRPVGSVFEEVKRADRRRLDGLVLEAIGFRKRVEREAVLDELYKAIVKLVKERLMKSRN